MQRIFTTTIAALLLLTACSRSDTPTTADISLGTLTVTLTGLDDVAGLDVRLRNTTTNSLFTEVTDDDGQATFRVVPGIYEATVSVSRSAEGMAYSYNGTAGQLAVRTNATTQAAIAVRQSRRSQLVIKELYNGGCMKDDGVTKFQHDKCIILYNNSEQPATLSHLCIGFTTPYNAQATNNNYNAKGRLTYEADGFIPVLDGFWYFPQPLAIEPFTEVVVNIHGAIDNTLTVSQSVSYANASYYCMYDPEVGYTNTSYYPTPSSVIPTSHYLKAAKWSLSNAWPLSVSSPALVIFQTHDMTPADFAADTSRQWYDGGTAQQSKLCLKVPAAWIVDAIEVYSAADPTACVKRLTADVDAGYVWLTNFQGHSLYRNVDRTATEALADNEGRLVYGYALGTGDAASSTVAGSTDPSGIDAEASIANGAHIIYQDTNNSTNDFHERKLCSLRNR